MNAASLRSRGSLACVLTVALTATACGGSSSSGAAKASGNIAAASTTSSSAATSSAAASAGAPTTSTGTTAPAATAGTPSTSTSAAVPSVPVAVTTTKVKATGGGDFCKNIANAVNNPITPTGGTSLKDEKTLIEKSLAQGELALRDAPAVIRSDAAIVLAAIDNLFKALEKANYDYTKIDPAALAGVSSPAVTTAEKHLADYVKNTCGFSLTSG